MTQYYVLKQAKKNMKSVWEQKKLKKNRVRHIPQPKFKEGYRKLQ